LIHRHPFDRFVDGFPEKADLANWCFRVRDENIYGNLSPAWTPGATGGAVDASDYGTWT
jgi:hypothetical protein